MAVLLSLLSIMLPASASAAGQSITISPTTTPLAVSAGQTTSGIIKVINGGDTPFDIKVSATPYAVQGENYDPEFKVTSGFNDASPWFSFTKTTYHMAPHQYQEVPYTIKVPARVGPGGYYATVFAETQPGASKSTGVQTVSRVGSIFYIRVNGSTSEGGKLASWQIPFIQYRMPVNGTLRLTNTGNVHFSADSEVVFKSVLGGHTTKIQDTHYVLPNTTRAIPIVWRNGPSLGIYKVTGTTSFLHQTQTLPAHYVVALPVIVMVIIAAVLIAIISGCGYLIASRRRR